MSLIFRMSKKVYIKLFAGLGNQLFQYTYGLYLERDGYEVHYILNRSKGDLLAVFHVDNSHRSLICAPQGGAQAAVLFIKKLIAKFVIKDYRTGFYQQAFYSDCFKQAPLRKLGLSFLHEAEYMHTPEYKDIHSCTAVSLHIRGGDYLQEKSYAGICTTEYYKNAVRYIKRHIPNAVFFIFTNDKQYAQNILNPVLKTDLKSARFIFNSCFADDPGFDLFLMHTCKHHIIANSTFSWWGAFLNENPEKIVITPEKWNFSEPTSEIQAQSEPADGIIPDNWIRIRR